MPARLDIEGSKRRTRIRFLTVPTLVPTLVQFPDHCTNLVQTQFHSCNVHFIRFLQ